MLFLTLCILHHLTCLAFWWFVSFPLTVLPFELSAALKCKVTDQETRSKKQTKNEQNVPFLRWNWYSSLEDSLFEELSTTRRSLATDFCPFDFRFHVWPESQCVCAFFIYAWHRWFEEVCRDSSRDPSKVHFQASAASIISMCRTVCILSHWNSWFT